MFPILSTFLLVKYPCCSLLCRGGPEGAEGQREAGGERDQQPEAGQEDQGTVLYVELLKFARKTADRGESSYTRRRRRSFILRQNIWNTPLTVGGPDQIFVILDCVYLRGWGWRMLFYLCDSGIKNYIVLFKSRLIYFFDKNERKTILDVVFIRRVNTNSVR
jgi:hypothetical protein